MHAAEPQGRRIHPLFGIQHREFVVGIGGGIVIGAHLDAGPRAVGSGMDNRARLGSGIAAFADKNNDVGIVGLVGDFVIAPFAQRVLDLGDGITIGGDHVTRELVAIVGGHVD